MKSPIELLLPYQRTWLDDPARFKIGMWARQTGKSTTTAVEAVRDALTRQTTWVCLSSGERQALEWMQKARQWTQAFEIAIRTYTEARNHPSALLRNAEIKYPNGSRILAIPANPNTARGYSANLILDEFAYHERPEEIWRAIYPSISNPLKGEYRLRITSTPNGKNNKFHELWHGNPSYSKHRIDIHTAIADGLPVKAKELRKALNDEEAWQQEFLCEFIDTTSTLLAYDLIATCEDPQIPHHCTEDELFDALKTPQPLYLGYDVARKRDLSALWLLEKTPEDLLKTRAIHTLLDTPLHRQTHLLERLLAHHPHGHARNPIRSAHIDSTGIGTQLAETLQARFGPRVTPIQFTQKTKQQLFAPLADIFQQRRIRIPAHKEIREDLHSLQRSLTPGGDIRYHAPHLPGGHADRATALALAIHAATGDTQAPFTYKTLLKSRNR